MKIGCKSELTRKKMIEKIKNYSEIVKEVNFEKKPKLIQIKESKMCQDVSKRNKMLEFARRIQRPANRNARSSTQQITKIELKPDEQFSFPRQIEFLENQHYLYQQKLKDLKIN